MIVCVCNAISEDELREAARRGAACPRSAYARLGCQPQCGTCLCYAQKVIDQERSRPVAVRSQAA